MKNPFPPHTLEAVGACTRALDGPDNADAILARAGAATVGGLRAGGDRLALRHRFHHERIQSSMRPGDDVAGGIFDAIELARLDAIGARWLQGVANNLLAHPGSDEDGVRWLAFESFSHRQAPT